MQVQDNEATVIERGSRGIRDELIGTAELARFIWKEAGPTAGKLKKLFVTLTYGQKHPSRGRRRIPMDVDKQVAAWHEAMLGLATAHDKNDEDKWEAKTDDLLGPLLTAPVKQLRELHAKLMKTLKEDQRIPYIIWRGLEKWGEVMVVNAPDQGVRKLKDKLAREIVELCEDQVLPQFGEAMVRALMWRSEEQLEEVKTQLEKGASPKIRGRESCLFLEVGKGKNKAMVQL